MFKSFFAPALLAVIVFAVCGCQSVTQPWLKSTYRMQPPIKLDVVSIDVNNLYTPQSDKPNVETQLSPRPDQVIAQWAPVYFQARGDSGRAVVLIEEASVVAQNRGENTAYTLNLTLKIEMLDLRGALIGEIKVKGRRMHEIPKSYTASERQQAWQIMMDELLGGIEPEIRLQLSSKIPKVMLER